MNEVAWIPVIIAALSGGAVGAVITAVVASYKARRQSVGRRVSVVPILRTDADVTGLRAELAVTHEETTYTFGNLFVVEVLVVNKGNRDFDQFAFGITLGAEDRCIFLESSACDRYHELTPKNVPTPNSPVQELDLVAKPFNRGDVYTMRLFLVISPDQLAPAEIELASAAPVRFVGLVSDALTSMSLDVGGTFAGSIVGLLGRTILRPRRPEIGGKIPPKS